MHRNDDFRHPRSRVESPNGTRYSHKAFARNARVYSIDWKEPPGSVRVLGKDAIELRREHISANGHFFVVELRLVEGLGNGHAFHGRYRSAIHHSTIALVGELANLSLGWQRRRATAKNENEWSKRER